MRTPLYTGHFTRSPRCMSTIEGFHCTQDTSPGPQGVHNRGVPLYIKMPTPSALHSYQVSFLLPSRFTQSFNRSNLLYRVVPKKPKKVTQDIIKIVNGSFRGQSGIVYCLSRSPWSSWCQYGPHILPDRGNLPLGTFTGFKRRGMMRCVSRDWGTAPLVLPR